MIYKTSSDPAVNEQRRARLDAQLETIGVELVGLEARQKVLEEQIAKLAKTSDEAAQDAVLEELKKAVELRSSTIAKLKTLRGAGSVAEGAVSKAELELIAAKAELAKYRREVGQVGNQRLTELRRRMDDTAIDMAEAKSKEEALESVAHTGKRFHGGSR